MKIDPASPPQSSRLERIDDPARHIRKVARDVQVFKLMPVRLQFGRDLLAFVVRLDPAGRQSKSARTRGISANRALERQSERDQDGWRLGVKEPALPPPAADDEAETYVPPVSKISRIRELRDKEWNKQ